MISLGKFLGGKAATWSGAMVALVHSLFDVFGEAAVNHEQARYDEFRLELNGLAERITAETEPESIPIVAGLFFKLADEYKRGIERVLKDQSAELKSLVKLMTKTVTALGADDTDSISKIRALNKDIDRVHTIRDIAEFKGRLKQSLDELQQSVELRKKNASLAVADLKRELDESRARLSDFRVDPKKDAVTGLPTRDDATNVLAYLCGRDDLGFVVILNVQQLPALNVKYGHQVGNVILQNYRDQLEQRLEAGGRLFRWGGKSFLIIFSKAESTKVDGADIVRSLGATVSLEIDTGTRRAMVPILPKCLCLGRSEKFSALQLIERIEKFAADLNLT